MKRIPNENEDHQRSNEDGDRAVSHSEVLPGRPRMKESQRGEVSDKNEQCKRMGVYGQDADRGVLEPTPESGVIDRSDEEIAGQNGRQENQRIAARLLRVLDDEGIDRH